MGYFYFLRSFLCLCVYFLPSLHTILLLGHCLVLIVVSYMCGIIMFIFLHRLATKTACSVNQGVVCVCLVEY